MDTNLDSQLQRWQAVNILREYFPDTDASVLPSVIREAFRDGGETCSHGELVQRCLEILEQRAKQAK
jgi:hypothetical protein